MSKLRVFVADDHPVVRSGLKGLIDAQPDMAVVGEAFDGAGAVRGVAELRPDVVVMDVSMPGVGGAEATERIRAETPGVRVLALTAHEDRGYLQLLLKAGASGYVLKRAAADDLVRAIRAAAAGVHLFLVKPADPAVLVGLMRRVKESFAPAPHAARTAGAADTPVGSHAIPNSGDRFSAARAAGGSPRRSLRVLAADADPAARDFYQKSLTALGHQPCRAESGRQVVALCRAVAPDLLIADDRLPHMPGFELAAAVCQERPVPVVLASESPDAAAWAAAECHVVGYLSKPLRADALGAAVAVAARCADRLRALGEEAAQLRQALDDRKVIERAKGLLMRFAGLDEGEAYRRLREFATRGGRKVVDVAREVVAAGDVFGHLIGDGQPDPPRTLRPDGAHVNGSPL